MLLKLFSALGRHPLAVLLTALAMGTGVGVLRETAGSPVRDAADLGYAVILLGSFGSAVLALYRYRPATLIARPHVAAFDTPPDVGLTLVIAAVTFQGSGTIADRLWEIADGQELRGIGLTFAMAWAVIISLAWWRLLRPLRVRLRPDGIEEHRAYGAMFVPWEAFAGVGYPAVPDGHGRVALTFSRPDLVRGRGWRPLGSALGPAGTDALFLSRVLHEYAHRPDLRAAIGSEAERDRLVQTWGSTPALR
ncbi:hypothetical protein QLQ12_20325 [Actinoplanes sp. NEAU-A12]|uniref:PH domain-containing protein n=1 Tax=Actinoplanes sandaracinus TaxID=3045177 RepID=A0ABT6WML3_9ACTN|nr:hypothetical protein [Actinoplanes sandaracinus]MDI6100964.1 hypothetical protein [Actinoplanes sandaracinus]